MPRLSITDGDLTELRDALDRARELAETVPIDHDKPCRASLSNADRILAALEAQWSAPKKSPAARSTPDQPARQNAADDKPLMPPICAAVIDFVNSGADCSLEALDTNPACVDLALRFHKTPEDIADDINRRYEAQRPFEVYGAYVIEDGNTPSETEKEIFTSKSRDAANRHAQYFADRWQRKIAFYVLPKERPAVFLRRFYPTTKKPRPFARLFSRQKKTTA